MTQLANHTIDHTVGSIPRPTPIQLIPAGEAGLGVFLTNVLSLIYAAAGIAFVFMIVWGAFEWITSGGNKEGIAAARKRILTAIIGLTLLSVSFVLISVIGFITGFELFAGQNQIQQLWHNQNIDNQYPNPYVGPGATHQPGNPF